MSGMKKAGKALWGVQNWYQWVILQDNFVTVCIPPPMSFGFPKGYKNGVLIEMHTEEETANWCHGGKKKETTGREE